MRFNTNIDTKGKKNIELENFLGVDFSSSPVNVSKKRSSFAKNLISVNGVNQKREGWSELYKILSDSGEPLPINGISKFKISGEEITLVHAGTKFFRVHKDVEHNVFTYEDVTSSSTLEECLVGTESHPLQNQKSMSFISNDKVYIIGCGDYLVYGKFSESEDFELRRVEDNTDTYIPITSFNIRSNSESRNSLDKINALTSKRKNRFYLEGHFSGDYRLFKLDSDIDDGSDVIIDVEVTNGVETDFGNIEEFERILSISNANVNTLTEFKEVTKASQIVTHGVYYKEENGVFKKVSYSEVNRPYPNDVVTGVYVRSKDILYSLDVGQELEAREDADPYPIGFINFDEGFIYISNLFSEMFESNGDSDNATIMFQKTIEGGADQINKCLFGIQFGYGSLSDTLFLSGNPEYPNQDFYSYTIQEDLSYFPVTNVQTFGTKSSSVKSYLRINDGTLAVLKEKNDEESTIYYRSATQTTKDSVVEIQFPVVAGAIGEGAVNHLTCCNLVGDNVFVSPNGIFGIVLANNIVSNERYARERDKYIHGFLMKHDLSNAVAVVYKGRYFLAVDGVCYIMDSRYKSTTQDDADDTYNYECWFWDNFPARCFHVYDEKLYFGTNDGGVCIVNNGEYSDITQENLLNGEIGFENNVVNVNAEKCQYLKENEKFYFTTDVFDSNNENIKFKRFYITELNGNSFKLRESLNSENTITIENAINPQGVIVIRKPVESVWYSPILDLGLYDYSKNLDSLSIVLDPNCHGEVNFGYETKRVNLDLIAKQIVKAQSKAGQHFFDFDDIDFDNFTFDTAFASSYTKKIRQRNINFIMFKVKSIDDKCSALLSLKATYTIYKKNRGVR